MIQFQWNVWTDKRKDNKQIIFHTTFPATAWGPKTKISIDSLQRYQRILRFSWIRLKTELTQPVSDLTFPWWLSPYKKFQVSIGINLRYQSKISFQRYWSSKNTAISLVDILGHKLSTRFFPDIWNIKNTVTHHFWD